MGEPTVVSGGCLIGFYVGATAIVGLALGLGLAATALLVLRCHAARAVVGAAVLLASGVDPPSDLEERLQWLHAAGLFLAPSTARCSRTRHDECLKGASGVFAVSRATAQLNIYRLPMPRTVAGDDRGACTG